MSDTSKLITIDPNSDTLIILENPKAELPELAIYEAPDSSDNEASDSGSATTSNATRNITHDSATNESDITLEVAPAVKFLVSFRQLRIVSPYFDNIFKGGYHETVLSPDDGLYHIRAEGWNPGALEVVLNIAHVQVKRIPNVVQLKLLVKILMIADYYQMQDTLAPHTKLWTSRIPALSRPVQYCTEAVHWLFVAFQLREDEMFTEMAKVIITTAPDYISTLDLPLSPVVQDELNYLRSAAIRKAHSGIQELMCELHAGQVGCSEACSAMLLGSLLRGLHKLDLLSTMQQHETDKFRHIRLDKLWESLPGIETPVWYESPQSETCHICKLALLLDNICFFSRIEAQVVLSEFGL